jgi:YD repeat-containing protein
VSFTYDGFGRLSSTTDGTGTASYTYVPFGQAGAPRLALEQRPAPYGAVSYSYDQGGRLVSRAIDGIPETWRYDSLGRVTTVVNQVGNFSCSYLGSSHVLSDIDEPNGQDFNYRYYGPQGSLRLQQILQRGADAVGLHHFQYDAIGKTTKSFQKNLAPDAAVWSIVYDADDELSAVRAAGNGLLSGNSDYHYDDAGNLSTLAGPSLAQTNYTFNGLNELLRLQAKLLGIAIRWPMISTGIRPAESVRRRLTRTRTGTINGTAPIG